MITELLFHWKNFKSFKVIIHLLLIGSCLLNMNSCLSQQLEVCVYNNIDTILIELCEDTLYIESITIYHLDSLSNKYITDWKILVAKNAQKVNRISVGKVPNGYIESKEFTKLGQEKYIIDIDSNCERGEVFMKKDKDGMITFIYDSVQPCKNKACNQMIE